MKKKLFALSIAFVINAATCAYAADQVVKEDTTPPAAEGALTAEQVPPIDSATHKALPPAPAPTYNVVPQTNVNDSTMVKPVGNR